MSSETPLSLVTLFAGGGLADVGAMLAGFTPVLAVEWNGDKKVGADDAIAQVYRDNFPGHDVLCQPVQTVNLSPYLHLAPIDCLWASPPCQNASIARSKNLERRDDADVGIDILRWTDALRPRSIVIENVPAYQHEEVFYEICAGLRWRNYTVWFDILNAADFGVPQTRSRLILIAVAENGPLPLLHPTHAAPGKLVKTSGNLFADEPLLPWNGWYGAIEDILHTLPPSQFAPWQLKRLPKDLQTMLLDGQNSRERGVSIRNADDPAITITASTGKRGKPRALLFERNGARDGNLVIRNADEPAWTMRASGRQCECATALLLHGSADNDRFPMRSGHCPAFTVLAGENRPRGFVCGSNHGPVKDEEAFVIAGNSNAERAYGDNKRDADEPMFCVTTNAVGRTKGYLCGVQGEAGELAREDDTPAPTITCAHAAAKYRAALMVGGGSVGKNVPTADAEAPSLCIKANNGTREPVRALLSHSAVLVEGDAAGARCPTMRDADAPCFTLKTPSGGRVHRAIKEDEGGGRVVSMTPRALARFQSVPDCYLLPTKASLACRVIGNGVACNFARAILSALRAVLLRHR